MFNKKTGQDNTTEKQEDLTRKLVKSLDELLSKENWGATLFLKANKKRLEELRDQAQALLDKLSLSNGNHKKGMRTPPPGYKTVYISLYQAESNNLLKWQGAISALEKYSISRPVYWEEEHVRALIRNKTDASKEAYVKVFVKETDILKPYSGKTIQDRFGHELITLRENAVKLINIEEFVHEGKHYYLADKQLVLI